METDKRRDQFVMAALELFTQKGIAGTTIGDISDRVGVARSLFYHYFPNKDAIVDAVVDNRVDDFVEQFENWGVEYDHNHSRQSLERVIAHLRSYLSDPNSFSSIVTRENNLILRRQFSVQSAKRLSQNYARKKERMPLQAGQAHLSHPRESFYIVIVGLISLMAQSPQTSDQVLVDVVAETMHIMLC